MADDDDSEKEHEPSQKKLDDARKKGEIPRAQDLNTAVAYGGFLLASLSIGASSLDKLGQLMSTMIDRAEAMSALLLTPGGLAPLGGLIARVLALTAPLLGIPAILVLLGLIAQRGLVFAPSKLEPKLSRINPLGNAKQKFGRSGLFEFAKSFVKLMIYSTILGIFLARKLPQMLATMALDPRQAVGLMLEMSLAFLALVLAVALSIGAVDFLWQHAEHMRKNRMSRKEMTDEMKDSEGDPHVKGQRRQKGQEIAMNQMLAEVPKADVVIVNPTHYAVALTWDRGRGTAPVCVAKGVDEIAARIREAAAEAAVPIHSDPPTARALHSMVEIGEEIHPDHYQVVAAAIRFSDTMRAKARKSWSGSTGGNT